MHRGVFVLVALVSLCACTEHQDNQKKDSDTPTASSDFIFLRIETFSRGGQSNVLKIFRHERTGLEFVLVPGGTFMMGSPLDNEPCSKDECPQHPVTVKPFFISRTEVTQSAWDSIRGDDERCWRGSDLPIEGVSWNDCTAWCKKAGLRLPAEAEWEYACRAGNKGSFCFQNEQEHLYEIAWYHFSSGYRTHTVGQLNPNAFGLYDMHGNVWEWCEDTWHENYSGAPNDGSAWVDSSYGEQVYRGGSWNQISEGCRSANRNKLKPNSRSNDLGFRPVFSPVPSEPTGDN